MYRQSYTKKGFTLIELLVVISILSLLSTIVLASVNQTRAKARDAQRILELGSLQQALEFYYDKNGFYAGNGADFAGWDASGANSIDNVLSPLIASPDKFLSKIPHDPVRKGPYFYYYGNLNILNPVDLTVNRCGGNNLERNKYLIIFKTETPHPELKLFWSEEDGYTGQNCLVP